MSIQFDSRMIVIYILFIFIAVFVVLYIWSTLGWEPPQQQEEKEVVITTKAEICQVEKQDKNEPVEEEEGEEEETKEAVEKVEIKETAKVPTKSNLTKREKKKRKKEAQLKREEAKLLKAEPLVTKIGRRIHQLPNYIREWKIVNPFAHRQIGEVEVKTALNEWNDYLLERNVQPQIVQILLNACKVALQDITCTSWTRISKVTRSILTVELEKHLAVQRPDQVSLFTDRLKNRSPTKPFQILFVGANGVGKSTTLAKFVRWLDSEQETPHIVAADTFRSGAIEQLKTHSRGLNVPLHESGYGQEPSKIVTHTMFQLSGTPTIVLVDSAGRMHTNKSLMFQLGTMVQKTQPDYICFVGEAISGHEGIEQIRKFQETIKANRIDGQGIDSIIMTKFDIVGNQIGSVLNLIIETQVPILFVGVGQQYEDLRSLSFPTIVEMLGL